MQYSTQDHRLVRLTTVLGSDAILVHHVHGHHAMSEGFSYTLDVFSEKHDAITGNQLIGTNATFVVMDQAGKETYYNGFITQMSSLGLSQDRATISYRLTIESALFMLGKETQCRIFQDDTIPEIVAKLLKPLTTAGLLKVDTQYEQTHEKKRFVVQYNETTEQFIKRLCRQANIAFYFIMANGKHTLKLFDTPTGCNTLKTPIRLQPHTMAHDHLNTWTQHNRFVSGQYAQRTYHYKEVNKGAQSTQHKSTGDKAKLPRTHEAESYLFTDDYSSSDGKAHLKNMMLKGTERQRFFQASGDCRFLVVGQHFKIKPVPEGVTLASPNETYTSTRVELTADVEGNYVRTALEAVPKGDLVYASGEKPTIHSVQSAVVTGPKGSEIFTDPLGRVKVRFYWDRDDKKKDQDTTCFLRVMQPMGGGAMGAHFTPRIGDEVVVAFTNGDPDRPFITGTLHHPEQLPPYTQHNGTRAGFRTRSTPKGKIKHCNELYFEDKKGNEEIYLQAQKDHNTLVKYNQSLKVGNDKSQEVGGDETKKIGDNMIVQIGKNLLIDAGNEIQLQVGGSVIKMTSSGIDITSNGKISIDGSPVKIN